MGQLWTRFHRKSSGFPDSLTVSLLTNGEQREIHDRFKLQAYQLLRCGKSSISGDGVFLIQDVPKNTILEICSVLNLSTNEAIYETADYAFKLTDGRVGLALGLISMVNHSDFPNAEIFFQLEGEQMKAILVSAFPLKKGTELTISYGRDWWRIRPHLRKR